jgi:hypothetical protein
MLNNLILQNQKNELLVKKLHLTGKTTMLYAGKFGGIYFDKEIIEYIKEGIAYFGKDKFKAIILSNIDANEFEKYLIEYKIDKENVSLHFIAHDEIQDYMNLADFAICPVKPIPTKRYCTPIKNGEYWAMGLPVVIPPNISDDSDIINKHNIGYVLGDMSSINYIASFEHIEKLINESGINERIRAIAFQYRDFSIADKIYEKIYAEKD